MLNEEKIRLMTELARFEKRHGNEMKDATSYFKEDYVGKRLIKSVVCYTFCSGLLFLFWFLLHLDMVLTSMQLSTIFSMVRDELSLYLFGLIAYAILTYIIYVRRYDYAAGMSRMYLAKLKHLQKRYEYQRKTQELAREERNS